MADPGSHYVAYACGLTEKLILNLHTDKAGEYQLQLFNPRTGAIRPLGKPRNLTTEFTWTPPDTNDWILHVSNVQVD